VSLPFFVAPSLMLLPARGFHERLNWLQFLFRFSSTLILITCGTTWFITFTTHRSNVKTDEISPTYLELVFGFALLYFLKPLSPFLSSTKRSRKYGGIALTEER
jgi:hypothetical protein